MLPWTKQRREGKELILSQQYSANQSGAYNLLPSAMSYSYNTVLQQIDCIKINLSGF